MLKASTIFQNQRNGRHHPHDVCRVDVHESLIKLYWLNEHDELLIATVAELLDPRCDGWLALAAVKARFAAIADWSLRHGSDLSLPAATCDAAVLSAMAATPLFCTRGRYHFCDWKFLAAVRAQCHVLTGDETPSHLN